MRAALCGLLIVAVILILSDRGDAGEVDWPMYRHDARATGATNAKGKIHTPAVWHEHYLGAPYQQFVTTKVADNRLVDLDGDGRRERFAIEERALVVQDEQGKELGRVAVTGRPLGQIVRVATLFPDRAGLQVIVFSNRMDNGEAEGYCFTFHRGAAKGELAWSTGPLANYYSPTLMLDDIDGDGRIEIVTVPHYRVEIFDAQTGKLKAAIPWETGRNYGVLTSRPRRDSKQKDILIVSDFMPHVDLLRFDEGKWRHAWGHKYVEPNIPLPNGRERAMRVGPNPVADFEGDGREEIVCMIFDAAIDGGWHLHVRDVDSGKLRNHIPGVWLWGVDDLDSDGRAELVYTPTAEIHPTQFCDLHIATLTKDGLRDRAVLRGVLPLQTIVDVPPSLDTIADNGRESLLIVDTNGDGVRELIVGERRERAGSEGRFVARSLSRDDKLATVWSFVRAGHRLNLVQAGPEVERPFVAKVRDLSTNVLVDVDAAGKIISETPLGRPAGFSTMPIAVDLDGDGRNEVVVQDAAQQLHALRFTKRGAPPEALWSIHGSRE